MEEEWIRTRSSAERLLDMVERYNLYHVKTLPYNDVQSVLEWLGVNRGDFTFNNNEDSVKVLTSFVNQRELINVGVMGLYDEPQIKGKDRLVVHIKRETRTPIKYDSIVLFRVIQCSAKAPYSQELSKLFKDAEETARNPRTSLFPMLAKSPTQCIKPIPQEEQPVIDGFAPSSFTTTKPRKPIVKIDNFGRKFKPLECTAEVNPWSVYADIAVHRDSKCEFDIEELITTPNKVLGRGGFGVTVPINDHLVAKTNLFPEMVNWSIPFMEDDFNRYAQIACQVEEVMIGVSMKHPNILRTFGGFWCNIPGYQLGGRAVLVMERALCSLQEFMVRIRGTPVVPVVELDTLLGLEYLRSRTIQHRDFTYRNVLVCHQPDRKPIPFAFKISDFGTACNFSTPDQPRGNRTNMAPEVLWCWNAATGSDMFSWYCVMWELHSGSPLVQYKGSRQGYCKKTYAENLANLVGVYSPEKDETFNLAYMKAINGRALHAKHKGKRPTVHMIQAKLSDMGCNIADKGFVSMGMLCITLFPQERWSPSRLLNLYRYVYLRHDIGQARLPSKQMPLSVQVGEYMPTDIIVSDDCVPEGLTKLVTEGYTTGSPVTVIKSDPKVYYGIDFIRLAPGLIQPYGWYSTKVKELEDVYKSKYMKRKANDTDNPVEVRRSKTAPGVYIDDPDEGTSTRVRGGRHQVPPQPAVTDVTQTPDWEDELLPVRPDEAHGTESAVRNAAEHVSTEVSHLDFADLEWSDKSVKMLSRSDVGDEILSSGDSNLSSVSDNLKGALDTPNAQVGSGVDTLVRGEAQGNDIAASVEDSPQPPSESTAEPVPEAVEEPQGTVILLGKKIEGEIDTTMVILKSHNEEEIARFKDNVIPLSQSMTRMHPLIFAGPRGGLCKCSRHNGMFIFQYAQFFEGCKQVVNWTTEDSPNSVYAFLLQVFLTFKAALDMKLLPTHMTEWRDVLIAKGAVMIDIVHYLSMNFNKPQSSMFGDQCESLLSLCTTMVAKHLPDSNLCTWLCGLRTGTPDSHVLTESIAWLRSVDPSERKTPYLVTLNGNHFTFRDYMSNIPSWLTHAGEEEEACNRSSAKLLVYGDPKPARGDQMAEGVGDTKLATLVKNIVLRMKTKIFRSARLEVTTLDCTQGLTKVTLNNSALSGISSVDQLDRSRLSNDKGNCYTHDAVSLTESKWAPVIKFTMFKREGPVQEFTVEYYRMTILMVLLSPQGSVRSLRELFQSVATFSVTDF